MPRKIRQLIADLRRAGFEELNGGRGSHRRFRHPQYPGTVVLSGAGGSDAHFYQEKQVRNAVTQVLQ